MTREPSTCAAGLRPALGSRVLQRGRTLAGTGPVRDLGLLDSACHRPRASILGQEAYSTLTGKAAALMHSLACNHALVDGNKRLALLATVVFLRINGYALDLTDDEAFALTMSVAAGQLDADGIQQQLRLAQAPP
jgi:death on curing protein